jgi:protein-disulfide isomerase
MNDISNETPHTMRGQSLAIPVAIVVGFSLIAAAIFFSGNNKTPTETTTKEDGVELVDKVEEVKGTLNPVTEADHIRGNPNAPIMIVEYSDFDCPFCKNFHETMVKIMNEYGVDGKVAWVYRHFPLEQLHPSAPQIALASECVAKLGDDEAFWKFADLVFGERGTNEPTNMLRLPEFAKSAGVSESDFESCVSAQETKSLVEEDFANGVSIGVRGTPYSVIVVGDQQFPISGAQPYNAVKQIVDGLVKQLENLPTN